MTYNECTTCGANNGRAGLLWGSSEHDRNECENCYTTRKTGKLCLSANLKRTDDEIEKTASILDGLFNTCNK